MKYQHCLNIPFTSEIFCNEMPSLQKYSLYIGNICLYYRNIGFTSELFAVKRLTNVGFTLKILPMKCKYCKNFCFIIRNENKFDYLQNKKLFLKSSLFIICITLAGGTQAGGYVLQLHKNGMKHGWFGTLILNEIFSKIMLI